MVREIREMSRNLFLLLREEDYIFFSQVKEAFIIVRYVKKNNDLCYVNNN